ncbi:hypothetical protein FQN54_004866 [Arachnomyces sp. PD_36]|nr:hypothetical protein FQN54_004866 [Arachnomyces sp. PD_36]
MAKPKRPSQQSTKNKPTPSTTPSSTPTTTPPVPFTPSPPSLTPFLSTLSPSTFYITHLDSTPTPLKRRVFLIPILLNILILALLTHRIHSGLKTYPTILASTFNPSHPSAINPSTTPWPELTTLILRRSSTFIIDYLLLTLLLPWPIRLILGPLRWRYSIGYRQTEIIIRKSRPKWDSNLLSSSNNRWIRGLGANAEEIINFTRDKVMPAMAPERVAKTGYLLVDADWDLDYEAMRRAHALVDAAAASSTSTSSDKQKEGDDTSLQLSSFRLALHIHESGPSPPNRGWLTYRLDPEHLKNPPTVPSSSS